VSMRLTQGLRRAAQIAPRAEAIVDGATRRDWAGTVERVARLAAGLGSLGLARGDRIAVLALNGHRYFETLYGTAWAGLVAVPLNVRYAAPEIDDVLADSGARALLIDDAFLPLLAKLATRERLAAVVHIGDGPAPAGLIAYEALLAAHAPAEDAGAAGDDLAGLYYTGGTTGRAKGVMLSHATLVSNALNVIAALRYERSTIYLHAPPMFHLADGCSTFGATMMGGRHVFMPRFDPARFLELVAAERITDTTLVPTMMAAILDRPELAASDTTSLRRIYYGAAPMPEAVIRRALAAFPATLLQQAWGMTELSPIACTIDPEYTTLEGPLAGRIRSCGRAVASVEVRIVGPDGCELPRGEVGEIVVRGPTVMLGYWNRPQETAQALREGWLHSGDAARMDEDGFVFVVDRLKDMIVSGGENVYSAEVENAISLLPGVAEVAAIGVPHATYGEAVHAIVVPRAGATLDAQTVIAHCRERIAAYKCPRTVEFRGEPLPLSAAGKVLKTALREPHWRGRDSRIV
jgi:long-chain acyl-CoA synthetase